MRKKSMIMTLSVLALIAVLAVGCKLIVSGTFIIVQDVNFGFTADTGFYWWPVDLTGNSTWEDHKDEIDNIDAVGFSFTIENTSVVDSEFDVWFVGSSVPAVPPPVGTPPLLFPPTGGVQVISGLAVAAGATRYVTYAESLTHLTNVDAFKNVIMTGRFDYYGRSTGGSGDDQFLITKGKVVITLSASS